MKTIKLGLFRHGHVANYKHFHGSFVTLISNLFVSYCFFENYDPFFILCLQIQWIYTICSRQQGTLPQRECGMGVVTAEKAGERHLIFNLPPSRPNPVPTLKSDSCLRSDWLVPSDQVSRRAFRLFVVFVKTLNGIIF